MGAWIALFAGLALIFIEFYLPGAIMGVAGVILIAAAVVMQLMNAESVWEILLFLAALILLTAGTIKLAVVTVRRRPSIYLDSDQEGYRAARYADDLKGKKGFCTTDLRPGGFVSIEGKKYAAISLSGFLDKKTAIIVSEVEGETLKVKRELQ